jgi:glycosyltransferase involved in cell wall biosynthesis
VGHPFSRDGGPANGDELHSYAPLQLESQRDLAQAAGDAVPVVSVVIPTHNGERTIGQTIESVLNQTLANFELIVVDDGSTDSTLAMLSQIADPRLKVLSHPNEGVATSRNRGLAHASAEYVAFLDHDDLWTPDKLQAQYRALHENPRAAVAYSLVDCIDESGRYLHPGSRVTAQGDVYARLLLTDFLDTTSNPLIRRDALETVGGFDQSFACADDWDLLLRLASRYPFVCVPMVQVLYREHPDSLSFDVARMEEAVLGVFERAFADAPAHLQHLKRASRGNLYKFLAARSLRGRPSRRRGLVAARYLRAAVRNDRLLPLMPAFAYSMGIVALMILLPPRVQAKFARWERFPGANALLRHIRNDPRRSSGLSGASGLATSCTSGRCIFRRVLASTESMICRYRAWIPAALTLVLILVALRGYSGGRAWRLGPPFGAVMGQDLRAVLRAAHEIKAGENPYAFALAFGRSPSFQQFLTWEVAPYPYPLLAAILTQPLTGLEPEAAINLWTVITLALIVGSALLAVRAFSNVGFAASAMRFVFILTLFYVYGPTQINLLLGQLDMLILFLLLLCYLLYRRGSSTGAAVSLAFAVALNPTAGAVLLFFAWKRQWRLLGVSIMTVILLTTAGFCLAGWDRLRDYLEVARLWSGGALLSFPHNQSVTGLALRMFTTNAYIEPLKIVPWLGHAIPILIGLLAVGGWLMSTTHADNRTEPANGVEYGLAMTTLLLISPQFSDIHFVWALVPISALLLASIEDLRDISGLFLLALWFLVALYLGYPSVQDKAYTGYQALLYSGELVERSKLLWTGAYLYGLIALDICMVIYLSLRRTNRYGPHRFASDRSKAACKEVT